jgi:uncharacterized membrane protein YgdD (TMEM256/DUF423 family)
MPILSRIALCAAALLLALATVLGAYGSHALPGRIDTAALHAYQTAIDYQFFHGLGLLALGLWLDRYPGQRGVMVSAALLGAGMLLFCGGLIAPILGAPPFLGAFVPFGGFLLIAGWLAFAVSLWITRGLRLGSPPVGPP